MNNNSNINENIKNKDNDKELVELEKKLLNMYYEELSVETIKKKLPSFFYYLSILFKPVTTVNNEDLILEYVFLNVASNTEILTFKDIMYDIFEQKFNI